jgi:hypothetical protein
MFSRGSTRATAARARGVAMLALIVSATLPAPAYAGTLATIRPSFLPDRLGARTAFTLAFGLSGVEGEPPPPLHGVVVHLPAGLRLDFSGVSSCSKARLQAHGAAGCAGGSLLGRGRAVLELHPASQTITEEATLTAFRGPEERGRPAILILSQGYTPLEERTVITGVLAPDAPRYGLRLAMSTPRVPTLQGEPDASMGSFSLTLGAGAGRAAHPAAAITVPGSCPRGGFPFAADFTFADRSTARASATARCP